MIGGPPLYFEAVSAQLLAQSIEIVPNNDATELEAADTILLYCETEADWDRLSALSGHHLVAVLPDFNLDGLVRALAAGASPAHLRTSSEIIVATARAAAVGEALLPMGLAKNLALRALASETPTELNSIELQLVAALANGHSIVQMAEELGYSDRTIRRKLQSLYVKLEVNSRAEATVRSQFIHRTNQTG